MCENFSKKLHDENEDIFCDTYEVDEILIKKDKDTKIKLRHRVWAKILERFL